MLQSVALLAPLYPDRTPTDNIPAGRTTGGHSSNRTPFGIIQRRCWMTPLGECVSESTYHCRSRPCDGSAWPGLLKGSWTTCKAKPPLTGKGSWIACKAWSVEVCGFRQGLDEDGCHCVALHFSYHSTVGGAWLKSATRIGMGLARGVEKNLRGCCLYSGNNEFVINGCNSNSVW